MVQFFRVLKKMLVLQKMEARLKKASLAMLNKKCKSKLIFARETKLLSHPKYFLPTLSARKERERTRRRRERERTDKRKTTISAEPMRKVLPYFPTKSPTSNPCMFSKKVLQINAITRKHTEMKTTELKLSMWKS